MANATVNFLLTRLSDFLTAEYNLLDGIEADITYIEDGFAMTSAFLRVAEANEEHNSNDLIKAWVNSVRDISFDMQDVLDEFKLHFAHNHIHTGICTATLDKTCHFIKSLKARRRIAQRMQGIRSRFHAISETYNLLPMANQNIIWTGINDGGTTAVQLNDQPDTLLGQCNLVGITGPKKQLIQWLLKGKLDLEVVSVVGEGGLGKTTLIKQVYDDAEVKQHFKFRAWITLTQRFETAELLRDMLQQLSRGMKRQSPSALNNMSITSLSSVTNELLKRRRYLIVLDDVWEPEAWDIFQMAFPNEKNGSRILLTTEILPVANHFSAESSNKIFRMKSLRPQESWELFRIHTFQGNPCPPSLKNISELILKKCGGLPLAIVAISRVLAAIGTSRIEKWEMVDRSFGDEIRSHDSLGRMRKLLLLSYYFLPSHLRSCLLYFCIFPEGYPIEKTRLIRLWIAEGFVTRTRGMTLEEVAESYLNGLIDRSLVQAVETPSDDRVKRCRMQGLLREIIISKAKDLGFMTIVTTERSMTLEKVRRLSIHINGTQTPYFTSRLCSLLVFSGLEPPPEFPTFSLTSPHLKMLFVLDLGGTPLKEFPDEITNLLLLKYLSLRDTKVNSIPSSIQKLQYLETLDMKNSCVTELPSSIVKLHKLRHLLVYRHETEVDDHLHTKYGIGFRLPTTTCIRNLVSLQKLCFLDPNRNTFLLRELETLTSLRRLGIINIREEDGGYLCSSILQLTNLRALSLSSTKESEVIDLNRLNSGPTYLQRLYLTGRLRTLPRCIPRLANLKKLVLKWSRLTENPLPHLQILPNLLHLEFLEAYEGEKLRFGGGFERLKFLGINKLDRLKEISVEKGAMQCLEKLVVQRCLLLKKVPSGIEHLHKLKVVEFINMPLELITTLPPNTDEYHGDYRRVGRGPEIKYYTYWNNGSWDVVSLYNKILLPVSKAGGILALTPIIGIILAIVIIVAIVNQWQR